MKNSLRTYSTHSQFFPPQSRWMMPVSFSKQAQEDKNKDLPRNMLIGAGLTSAAPVASHLRYELAERPGYARQINELVDRASAEGKIFVNSKKYGGLNPLQRRMQLGDVILQSFTGRPLWDGLKGKGFDFATLSLGGSGGPMPHAAVADATGRAIDPGKYGLSSFKDKLLTYIVRPHKINRDAIKELREVRRIKPRTQADATFLQSFASDPFNSDARFPSASVVLRPQNLSNIDDSKVMSTLADIKGVGYSKTDAALAGLRRILSPLRPWHKARSKPNIALGTFCSHGTCTIQALRGLNTPTPADALPPDLLKVKGQDLLGIGINRAALGQMAGSGISGKKRLAEAARRTFMNTLREAAKTRRILAGAVTAAAAGAGALGGAGYTKLFPDNKLIDKDTVLQAFRSMLQKRNS